MDCLSLPNYSSSFPFIWKWQRNHYFYLFNKIRHICSLWPTKRLNRMGWNFLWTLMGGLGWHRLNFFFSFPNIFFTDNTGPFTSLYSINWSRNKYLNQFQIYKHLDHILKSQDQDINTRISIYAFYIGSPFMICYTSCSPFILVRPSWYVILLVHPLITDCH